MAYIENSVLRNNKGRLGTPCIVCGETVQLTENEEMLVRRGHNIPSKMCDKCKNVILDIRKRIDNPIALD